MSAKAILLAVGCLEIALCIELDYEIAKLDHT